MLLIYKYVHLCNSALPKMKGKELSDDQKEIIIKLKKKKKSIRDIAKTLDIAKSTVQNVWSKFVKFGSVKNHPRSGRPKCTSVVDDRKMVTSVKKNAKSSASKIASDLTKAGVKVSSQTVRNRLRTSGYRGCTARRKPLISAKNRRARLEFAKKYVSESVEFWENVLWTDETKINFFQSDGKQKVWRKKNTAHNPRCTTPSVKYGGGGVMAWACMAASGTGSMVFIDEITDDHSSIMNSTVYINILRANISTNARKLIGRRFWLQQDNDPKHKSKATTDFLKQQKWKILEWPSQSPDLNPIEHMFHILKTKMADTCPANKAELKRVTIDAWNSINESTCKTLVHSMQRRLTAVIANKGYATKY